MTGRAEHDPITGHARRTAFDGALVGLALLSGDGDTVCVANPALHALLGRPPGSLDGAPVADLAGDAAALHSGIRVWRRADGVEIDVRVRRSGETLVVEAVDADEAAHSDANRDAMAAAGLGEWRWDRARGVITLSHRAARILGQPPGRSVTWSVLRPLLTEPQRVSRLVAEAVENQEPCRFETNLAIEGRGIVVQVSGQALTDEAGHFVGMVGVVQDITTRIETRSELQAHDHRLRAATAVAKLGIFEWHMLDDHAVWENDRMFEIFGHAPEDGTIGKTEFLSGILHPDDRAAVRKAISAALREDRDLHISGRIRRKSDGAWRTIDMAGRFERDAPDRLPRRLIGVVADVTDRRLAEERQTLLIRELHHRVKNTLATVQAIVGSTARTATDIDSFYEAFVGRIKSLAHTHSVLTEATWQTASLTGLLVNELRPYAEVAEAGGEDGRIVLDGPAIDLPSDIAVPVGMAIHELTTNAAKYGALSNRVGRVTVAWDLEPGGPAGTLRLTWRETGGPRVQPPRRQGFGSRLLHRVLITQVQAEVTTDYAPDGFSLTMRAPLPVRNASLNPLA
ncbi:sensor histidine kinase [Methylobacterium sp. J-076]|uniref:sensor histidine kinase n=1 Tax=Methylobacterium sp. J-076 TaxID=2836655 RepID=UPI001FBA9BA7|nr:HWE histidine kinase domain-containing protein [Methylobacterium sp. J-076]MCJ2011310.1 PAS domain S-box protein [Methylobacterium sp. J-076]